MKSTDSSTVTEAPDGTRASALVRVGRDRKVQEPSMATRQVSSPVGSETMLVRTTRHTVSATASASPISTPSSRLRNTTPTTVTA